MTKRDKSMPMGLLVVLMALGVAELGYGMVIGPLGILPREASMYSDLVQNDVLQNRAAALGRHVEALKQQWHMVRIFGVANIVICVLV